jgi:protein TonB
VQNEEVVEVVEVKEEIQEVEAEPEPFVVVEEMPMFPGGDAELLKYIAANTIYPEVAKENNIQGRVIVRFCVTAKGGVSQVSILKGVDPELDAEAIRVVNTLPEFKPGKQGGKPVPVWYMVPITFTLK